MTSKLGRRRRCRRWLDIASRSIDQWRRRGSSWELLSGFHSLQSKLISQLQIFVLRNKHWAHIIWETHFVIKSAARYITAELLVAAMMVDVHQSGIK